MNGPKTIDDFLKNIDLEDDLDKPLDRYQEEQEPEDTEIIDEDEDIEDPDDDADFNKRWYSYEN